MTRRMQQRRDTAENWSSVNPTLASGEIGFESDTGNVKIGDGTTAWNDLQGFVANPDNTYRVSGNGGDFSTIDEAFDYLSGLVGQTDAVRLTLDAGSYDISDTITVDLDFHVVVDGCGSNAVFLNAATGLATKPMFDIQSPIDFKGVTFDGTTLSGWSDSDNAVFLKMTVADVYVEITDFLMYGGAIGILCEDNQDVFIFNFGIYDSRIAGIRYDSSTNTGGGLDVEIGEFENCGIGVDLVAGEDVNTYLDSLSFLPSSGNIALKYDRSNFTYSIFSNVNLLWDQTGTFLSGFDFTNAADADIAFVGTLGSKNNTPYAYIRRAANSTQTTLAANTWTKAELGTLDESVGDKFTISGNRITYLPSAVRNLEVSLTGSFRIGSTVTRTFNYAIVKNGDSNLRYGQNTVTLDTANRNFTVTINAPLVDVESGDYFELWVYEVSNTTPLIVYDVHWITTSVL